MHQTILGIARRHGTIAMLFLLAGVGLSTSERADAASCCAPPTGMISWFPGDGTAEDVRGGNDGTLQNGATYAPGKVGQAFSFDGVDDYVSTTALTAGLQDLTLDAWARTSQVTSTAHPYDDPAIMGTVQGNGLTQDLLLTVRNGHLASYDELNGTEHGFETSAFIADGQWHHVALTRSAGTLSYYVDGVRVATEATGTLPVRNDIFEIGRSHWIDPSLTFTGLIDEVEVHDRALSAAEIQSNHEAGSAGKCSFQLCSTPPPALVAWYRGEDAATDSQGSHDGILRQGAGFAAGKVGKAFQFDGVDDFVEIPTTPGLLPTSAATYALWVYPEPADDGSLLMISEGSFALHRSDNCCGKPADAFMFTFGGLTGLIDDGGGWTSANAAIPTGQWSHLVLTYDGSAIRSYVNGSLTRTLAASGQIGAGGNVTLGRRLGAFDLPLVGKIDEAQIYSRALTPAEVGELYNAGGIGAGNCADCSALPSGLAAWLKGEGNADDSTSANHGSLRNGATANADGIVGQAFSFDGVDDVVVVPDAAAQRPDHISVAAWVRMDDLNGIQSIAQKRNQVGGFGSFDGFHLYTDGNQVAFGGFLPAQTFVYSASTIQAGRWYHVVATYDRQFMRIYVDGVLEGTLASTQPLDLEPSVPLFIGGNGDPEPNFPYPLHGQIDEFQLYNRALSAAEIERIHRAGARGTCFDLLPAPFDFPNRTEVPPNAMVESAVLTPGGFDGPVPLTVQGGQYRINGGSWTSSAGQLRPGETLQVRLTSASTVNTNRNMSVTLGGVRALFRTKTRAVLGDINPDAFGFPNRNNAPLNTQIQSALVTPTGYDSSAPISIDQGEFSIDGGAFTPGPSTISPGQTLRLRTTTAGTNAAKFELAVTIGTTKGKWVGKTLP